MTRILAVDLGDRRIGLAVSDPSGLIASPAGRIETDSAENAVQAVAQAARDKEAEEILVGVPFNMDGSVGEMGRKSLDFAERLRDVTGLPVHTWDERLTSVQADRALRQGSMSRKKRKQRRDIVAAQIILQSYLDARGQS